MLPGHYLSGTKILKCVRKIMRCLPNFLMREAMNAILGRFRLPAVAKINVRFQPDLHTSILSVDFLRLSTQHGT